VEALLARGADPNTTLPAGETVLMTAARTGDVATLEALLEAGADVNAKEGWKGQTALMWAASENNAAAVTKLVEAGADITARYVGDDFSALSFTVRDGANATTQALLEAGADVNDLLDDGTSMLLLA